MQTLTINLPLYSITITGDHETDLFKKATFWLSLPVKCPRCDRPLVLNYRTPQTFEYYELRCTGDRVTHSINLGESKGTHNLYFDPKKEWKAYTAGETPGDIANRERSATPEQASPSSVTPGTASPAAAEPPPINAFAVMRNDLLKAIQHCKAAGIRCGIVPGDVGAMEPETLTKEIERLGNLLLNQPKGN